MAQEGLHDMFNRIINHYEGIIHYSFPDEMKTPDGGVNPIDLFRNYMNTVFEQRQGMINDHELKEACQDFITYLTEMEGSQERPIEERQTMDEYVEGFNEVIKKLTEAYGDVYSANRIVADVDDSIKKNRHSLGRELDKEEIFEIGDLLDDYYSHHIRQRTEQQDESLFGSPAPKTDNE